MSCDRPFKKDKLMKGKMKGKEIEQLFKEVEEKIKSIENIDELILNRDKANNDRIKALDILGSHNLVDKIGRPISNQKLKGRY